MPGAAGLKRIRRCRAPFQSFQQMFALPLLESLSAGETPYCSCSGMTGFLALPLHPNTAQISCCALTQREIDLATSRNLLPAAAHAAKNYPIYKPAGTHCDVNVEILLS
jgi:hypothetical protein